ncbi:porin [Roseinatronobacter bogoriensis]|uniref:Porin n=1 Tax=Roseinatronobacter bogoriensis subsp. barguzinensis TaxID=441209 RepID=A0A2K8KHB4_9RHOB|nr:MULTISPECIES: porin [Rhodobaca]ATX67165.1 porin [Rhodobaca barguzinensis]MBB4206694.1 outer membrane protein OmpU [Rhodobaca bogoriensis DSM 18756]TDW41438.1 outer membrane protein OmpU [Rhodobaca barguzinensis]TDY74384.1 outer membrane protein OmpU [Rhodobaca bogoriensis DSM 18756]
MKKLLLATTALTLSAGVAAADVAVSGDARMGLEYNGDDVQLTSRARVIFTMTGETDTGLAFGASFRGDQIGGANGNTNMNAGTVFISGAFGKLSFGDVGSAARSAVGDLHGVGLTGLGFANEYPFLDRLYETAQAAAAGVDIFDEAALAAFDAPFSYNTAAMYEYSIDALSVYASVGQFNVARDFAIAGDKLTGMNAAIGARYDFGDFGVSAGYEVSRLKYDDGVDSDSLNANHLVVGVDATFEGINVKAIYGRAGGDLGDALKDNSDTSRDQYGISMSASFDAVGVSAFAHRDFFRTTNIGVGASYDLGGGARIVGGVRNENPKGSSSNTTADFGVAFSF